MISRNTGGFFANDDAVREVIWHLTSALPLAGYQDKQLMLAMRCECQMQVSERDHALENGYAVMRSGQLTRE